MKLIVAYVQTPLPSGKIDIHSDEFSLECGMPQGSCLGPILFMLCSVGSLSKLISLEFIVMQTIHRFTFLSVLILLWTSFRTENCLSALDIGYLFVDV